MHDSELHRGTARLITIWWAIEATNAADTAWTEITVGPANSEIDELRWPIYDMMVVRLMDRQTVAGRSTGSVWLSNDQGMSFEEAKRSLGIWIEARMSFWRWAETWASKVHFWINKNRMVIVPAMSRLPATCTVKRRRAEFDMQRHNNAPDL